LNSSVGSSTSATTDLIVTDARPGFSKAFSPTSIPLGGRSTLTLTVDNSAAPEDTEVRALVQPTFVFDDFLPPGMIIATPANAATTCGPPPLSPTLTATAGTSVVSLLVNGTAGSPAVAAGATCTVTVDVTGTAIGTLVNTSLDLDLDLDAAVEVFAGKATAALTVTAGGSITLVKSFTDDPVPPAAP
jgi:hypothetical protein